MKCSECHQEGHNKRTCKNITKSVLAQKIDKETDIKLESVIIEKEMSENFENVEDDNSFYDEKLCLRKIKCCIKVTNEHYLPEELKASRNNYYYYQCILPNGHTGKCEQNMNFMFKKNNITKKMLKSIDTVIFKTPGNDDYVYKNRASRLYPYSLTSEQEKNIRDKKIKKRCAIPKKDSSTPRYLAEAYIDWMTFIVNIHDISEHIIIDEYEKYGIKNMLEKNKQHLINFYKNRQIFDIYGNTICVIKKTKINLIDVSDIDRDNRVNPMDTDLQLGHNIARSDDYITIKGKNLLPMTRRGNLIIGQHKFSDDKWINELKAIVFDL
jgi:hypothetical protein